MRKAFPSGRSVEYLDQIASRIEAMLCSRLVSQAARPRPRRPTRPAVGADTELSTLVRMFADQSRAILRRLAPRRFSFCLLARSQWAVIRKSLLHSLALCPPFGVPRGEPLVCPLSHLARILIYGLTLSLSLYHLPTRCRRCHRGG